MVRTSIACRQYRADWISSSFCSSHWFTVAEAVTLTTFMTSTVGLLEDCRERYTRLKHTVVGGNKLVTPVVWLPSLDVFLPILSARGQFIGPIHPVYSCIYVMLVARTNLENPSNPIIIRSLPWLHRFVWVLLALDSGAVGDKDEAFAVVFDTVHCGKQPH